VREIRLLRSMSGVWKRSYGQPTKAPPDERGGNRHGRPKTTAPHPDSTELSRSPTTDWTRAFAVVNYEQAVEPFLATDRLSATERAMLMGGASAKAYGWSPKKS
jgi:hypothetical protein